jgi:hypothetical protein
MSVAANLNLIVRSPCGYVRTSFGAGERRLTGVPERLSLRTETMTFFVGG